MHGERESEKWDRRSKGSLLTWNNTWEEQQLSSNISAHFPDYSDEML